MLIMGTVTHSKKGQTGLRKPSMPLKAESEQLLKFGEPAQLPNGISVERVVTNNYKGEAPSGGVGSDFTSLGGPGLDGNLY